MQQIPFFYSDSIKRQPCIEKTGYYDTLTENYILGLFWKDYAPPPPQKKDHVPNLT